MLITFLLLQYCCWQSVQLKRRTLFRWSHSSFIQLYVFCFCFQIFSEFYSNLYKCFLIENSYSCWCVGNIWKEEFRVSCYGKSVEKESLAQFGLKIRGGGGGALPWIRTACYEASFHSPMYLVIFREWPFCSKDKEILQAIASERHRRAYKGQIQI